MEGGGRYATHLRPERVLVQRRSVDKVFRLCDVERVSHKALLSVRERRQRILGLVPRAEDEGGEASCENRGQGDGDSELVLRHRGVEAECEQELVAFDGGNGEIPRPTRVRESSHSASRDRRQVEARLSRQLDSLDRVCSGRTGRKVAHLSASSGRSINSFAGRADKCGLLTPLTSRNRWAISLVTSIYKPFLLKDGCVCHTARHQLECAVPFDLMHSPR